MTAALRATAPLVPRLPRRDAKPRFDPARTAFGFGFAAVVVHFLFSATLLGAIGIDYASPGGDPLIKLHPGTYLALLGAGAIVFLAPRPSEAIGRLFRDKPGLMGFLILVFGCAIYSIFSVGYSGSAVYVESFLAPGLLALSLEAGSARARRILGFTVLTFVLVNIVISVGESLTQTHLITPTFDGMKLTDTLESDFRGAALFDHPLTGAMVTSMAVFLLLSMRLRPLIAAPAFTALMIGLFAFGGRAALATTLLILVGATLFVLLRGLIARQLSGRFVAAFWGGLLVLIPLLVVIVLTTSVGQRIVDHFYVDDSAEVRNIQWEALNYLTPRDVLFGTTPAAEVSIKAQIGLSAHNTDIENFWLLIFLNLGIIGFACFLTGFAMFLVHLGRSASALGWMLLVSTIVIASSSNSLGRKSDDLIFMTACMVAMTQTRRSAEARAPSTSRALAAPSRGPLHPWPVAAASEHHLSTTPRPRTRTMLSTLAGYTPR